MAAADKFFYRVAEPLEPPTTSPVGRLDVPVRYLTGWIDNGAEKTVTLGDATPANKNMQAIVLPSAWYDQHDESTFRSFAPPADERPQIISGLLSSSSPTPLTDVLVGNYFFRFSLGGRGVSLSNEAKQNGSVTINIDGRGNFTYPLSIFTEHATSARGTRFYEIANTDFSGDVYTLLSSRRRGSSGTLILRDYTITSFFRPNSWYLIQVRGQNADGLGPISEDWARTAAA